MIESKGRLASATRSLETGRLLLTFEVEKDLSGVIDEARGAELTITAKKYRQKRSLDANAYYWLLISKLADKLRISKPYLHNIMLRHYGQPEIIDDKKIHLVLPDNDGGTRRADEAETYHIKPTSEVTFGKDGTGYRTYIMLRGSSTYDTDEMSTLINGLVDECQEQGVDTITPEELERMMAMYDQKWRKKNEEAV